MQEHNSYWSPGGQIYYCGGRAYGVLSSGFTLDMGSEDEILKALRDGTSIGNNNVDRILMAEEVARRKQKRFQEYTPQRTKSKSGGLIVK